MGKKHKSNRDRSRSPARRSSHSPPVKREPEVDDAFRHQRNGVRSPDRDDRRRDAGSPEARRRDGAHRHRRDDPRRREERRRRRSGEEEGARVKDEWGRDDKRGGGGGFKKEEQTAEEKQKPNLGLSGKLTEDTNTFRGVVIKYNEPAEARKPKVKWRFYQFKGTESLPTLYVHRQSAYLIGRDRLIADIPVDHPSCSKQHAVLQFRLVDYVRDDGSQGRRVSPYIIDLGATNKTYLNNKPIEAQRYHELREKDVLKFGYSSREYVLLHDRSADDAESDEGGD